MSSPKYDIYYETEGVYSNGKNKILLKTNNNTECTKKIKCNIFSNTFSLEKIFMKKKLVVIRFFFSTDGEVKILIQNGKMYNTF